MRRLVLAFLLLLASRAEAAGPLFDPFDVSAIEPRLGAALPTRLSFRDDAGAQVTLADYLGDKPILLAPVDLDCANICGVTLGMLLSALAAAELEADAFELVAVSIDPRETPSDAQAVRAEHLARFPRSEIGPAVHFLVGEEPAPARLADAIGFNYAYDPATDQFAHPAAVAVVTPDGRLARWLYGYPFEPSDLRLALVEASDGTVGTLADRLWLLCYGYDPETGRYNALVGTILKAAGGVTVLMLGGLIAGMLWRERLQDRRPR